MPTNAAIAASTNRTHKLPQRPPEIKENDKFFSRLLAKEQSSNHPAAESPSFRVYYGTASGSVPFLWESQPGTPKHPLSGSSLPPLSPPPSYHTAFLEKSSTSSSNRSKQRSRRLLSMLIPRLWFVRRNANVRPTSPVSVFMWSLSSSSSSSFSSANSKPDSVKRRRRRLTMFRRSTSSLHTEMGADGEKEECNGAPAPTLCFFGSRRGSRKTGSVKDALSLFITGRRSCLNKAVAA